jgi:prepilin-type processing-associated H-X9-DG protein
MEKRAMNPVDTRQVNRESLLLLANLQVDGQDASYRVRVRNLSAGGMMAETDANVARGSRVSVELRNIGWVDGSVAWRQDNRFGIAFVDAIDPGKVREPITQATERSEEMRRFSPIRQPAQDPEKLRKI